MLYYEQDGIVIYHGDCREILPELPKVDLVLTDPPYGIGNFVQTTGSLRGRGENYGVAVDWNDATPEAEVFDEIKRKGRHRIIWGANFFNCFESGGGAIVWVKEQKMPNFSKADIASCTYFKKTEIITIPWTNFVTTHRAETNHPCERPVELYRWCLDYIPPARNGTVLDPFMGGGTTLRAAKDLGRKAIGIEIEERYCEIAAKRLGQGVLPFLNNQEEG